jgi:hypothetical protein
LAEWLRRVLAKRMGFPRESSNLSGDVFVTKKKKTKEFKHVTINLMSIMNFLIIIIIIIINYLHEGYVRPHVTFYHTLEAAIDHVIYEFVVVYLILKKLSYCFRV